MKHSLLIFAAVVSLSTLPAQACLWDSDTLAMEKARFPGVSEILSGNFPRHSRAFFEWRVKQCVAALAKDSAGAGLYDDLAVAQHKLGDHRAAIATMQKKDAVKPGLYETYSNLGTFYIYTGELKEAVVWIDKALAVNPNAHFGREKYQKWLVEWILAGKPGPASGPAMVQPAGFANFVLEQQKDSAPKGTGGNPPSFAAKEKWADEKLKEARNGVLGMMRFADYDNPLLQEALGDILTSGSFRGNAGHLAVQAYRQALEKSKDDGGARTRLLEKINTTTKRHEGFKLSETVADLEAAAARGKVLTEQVMKDEAAWIEAGKDASAEFTAKYLKPAPAKKR